MDRPARLRVGVIGGGLIAQAAHLPSLRLLDDRFDVVALADPSRVVRDAVGRRYGIEHVDADWRGLIGEIELDAALILTPPQTHAEIVLGTLGAGLDVFVEKPLCILTSDADAIIETRDRYDKVVQVGYMKRHDLAYERLIEEVTATDDALQLINTVTFDPGLGQEPYFADGYLASALDLPPALLEEGRAKLEHQLAHAFPGADPGTLGPFASIYLDALVHEVNLVSGALEALELGPAKPEFSRVVSGGRAASSVLRLANGGSWQMAFLILDRLQHFEERIEFLFPTAVDRLVFSAPYLQEHGATHERLTASSRVVTGRPSGRHRGSYVRQLVHFHECVTEGRVCVTPPEMARADIALLTELFAITLE